MDLLGTPKQSKLLHTSCDNSAHLSHLPFFLPVFTMKPQLVSMPLRLSAVLAEVRGTAGGLAGLDIPAPQAGDVGCLPCTASDFWDGAAMGVDRTGHLVVVGQETAPACNEGSID